MSFFDEDDEPRARGPRPRRAAPAGPVVADQQTILIRRAVLLGAAVLIFIALVLLVRGCLGSRQKNALRDYTQQVNALIQDSDSQVGQQFFVALNEARSDSANDLEVTINQLRVAAEQQYNAAEKLEPPDDMAAAHRSLLIELELRKDGLFYIARKIAGAKSTEEGTREKAVEQIAGQMQTFLASDVIHTQRTVPLMSKALKDNKVAGIAPTRSRFFAGVEWLSPRTISDKLGADVSTSGNDTGTNEPPAPGLHGTGLDSVSIGDKVLQGQPKSNILDASTDQTFQVKFTNQGENDESDVRVIIRIEPSEGSGKAIRLSKTIDLVPQGTQATASLALTETPPIGEVVTINVEIQPVPGEKKTDNNRAKYAALFNR